MRVFSIRVGLSLGVIAVILSAWGLSDFPNFASETSRPIATGIVAIVYFVTGAAGFRLLARDGLPGLHALLPIASSAGFLFGLWVFPFLDSHPEFGVLISFEEWVRWPGVVLLASGGVVGVWSVASLGEWFTPQIAILPGHRLMTDGPYRVVRHPFYSGSLLSVMGYPAAFGSPLGFFALLVVVPMLIVRIEKEERVLAREFGREFTEFVERTPSRLIPWIF